MPVQSAARSAATDPASGWPSTGVRLSSGGGGGAADRRSRARRCQGIADGRARASAYRLIAKAQSGVRAEALRSVEAAADTAVGVGADLHDLAVAQAFTGDNGAARATVRRVAGASERDEALAEFSGVQCRANRVAEAVATTREMASPGARCGALVRIGDVLVRDGDRGPAAEVVVLAEEAAGTIGDGSGRARALVEIARLQLDCAVGRRRVARVPGFGSVSGRGRFRCVGCLCHLILECRQPASVHASGGPISASSVRTIARNSGSRF